MIIDKFAGLRNNVPSERLNPGELVEATNVLVNDDFEVRRRPGAVSVVSGNNFHSLWSYGEICLFVFESNLCILDVTLTQFTAIRVGLTLNAPMSYAYCDGKVYWCNGHERGVVDGYESRSWGIVPPDGFPAEVVPGDLDAGTYQYTMTYLRQDGQESGAGDILKLELSEPGGIRFYDLPISDDADIVGKRLYLSTANGEMLYELASTLNITTGHTVTDAELSIPGETIFACDPPGSAHLVAEYFGHMLLAVDNYLYYSKSYGPELFDWLDYYPFDSRITMIAPTASGVFVGTEQVTCFLGGNSPSEFTITEKSNYGVIEGTLATDRTGLLNFEGVDESTFSMWHSRKGVCVGLPGGAMYNLTDPNYQENSKTSRGAGVIRNIGGSTYYHATV